ncbi:unnamed protein product [Closterium sp. Naga37s-1]|nr:unnamed protein product [Closterium sp. Naga37s-1]
MASLASLLPRTPSPALLHRSPPPLHSLVPLPLLLPSPRANGLCRPCCAAPRSAVARTSLAARTPALRPRVGEKVPPCRAAAESEAVGDGAGERKTVSLGTAVLPADCDLAALETMMAQVGMAQVGMAQVGMAQVGMAQVGMAQVRMAQVRMAQVRMARVGMAQVRMAQVRAAQVRAAHVRAAQVRAAQVRAAQVRAAQWATSLTQDANLPLQSPLKVCSPLHLSSFSPLLLSSSPPLHLSTSPPLLLSSSPPLHISTSPPLLLSSSPSLFLSSSPLLLDSPPPLLSTSPFQLHLSTSPPLHLSISPPPLLHLNTTQFCLLPCNMLRAPAIVCPSFSRIRG